MKPEVKASPAAAPPAALDNSEHPTQSYSDSPSPLPPSTRPRRLPSLLVVMLVVYGLWLGWLAYVALVNVRAGNQ